MAAAPELLPELGPEEEVAVRALPRIGLVAILCVVLGIILSVEAIVRGFFGTISGALGWIPYLGQVVEEPITKIEQKIVSMLDGLEHDVDRALAHNIHVAARLLDKLWHSLELIAANVVLLGALGTAAVFHYLIHPLERWIRHAITRVESGISHAINFAHNLERKVVRDIEHWLWPKVKALTVAVPKYIHRDLLALRKDVNAAKKAATQALNQVEAIPFPDGATTWAAAVAIALPQLGLDWLNCKSNPFKNNGAACGLWNLLKDLLGLAASVIALEAVCEFLPVIEAAFGAIAGPMVHLLNEVPLGACEKPPSGWANLSVAAGPLPPAQTLGTLPS